MRVHQISLKDQLKDHTKCKKVRSCDICTPAMEKGKKWEEYAFNRYKEVMEKEHHYNLSVSKSGLVIGKDIVLGASPDRLISCECYGKGVVEIKSATKFEDQDPNLKEVT